MNLFRELDRHRGVALVTERREVGYPDFLSAADFLGARVPARRLVFVLGGNTFEALAGYVGFMRAGAVPVLLDAGIHDALLVRLLEAYRPDYMYLPASSPRGQRALAPVAALGAYTLIRVADESGEVPHEELALLLSTSGSTGSAKFVRLSHENLSSNAEAIRESLGISAEDRPITTLPMSYSYGLSIIHSHLLAGAALVLNDASLMEKRFWDRLRQARATTFGGVPYVYEMLKKLRFEGMDLPSLRSLTQAGGRLGPELAAEFAAICARKGLTFHVMYGQTEATARMACLPWESAAAKAGSVGVAIPGGELSLESETGEVLAGPATGELVYRGRNVSWGYAEGRADLARGDENRGVLRTGDLASRDADGFYSIVGRKMRFLKVHGHRVNLDEIERLLREAGHDCACSGQDDLLVVHAAGGADAAALRTFAAERTGLHPSALRVVAVAKIPRAESGKVLYSELAG